MALPGPGRPGRLCASDRVDARQARWSELVAWRLARSSSGRSMANWTLVILCDVAVGVFVHAQATRSCLSSPILRPWCGRVSVRFFWPASVGNRATTGGFDSVLSTRCGGADGPSWRSPGPRGIRHVPACGAALGWPGGSKALPARAIARRPGHGLSTRWPSLWLVSCES